MIPTDLYIDEVPDILRRLQSLLGGQPWADRARAVGADMKGRPYLADHLRTENAIPLALDDWYARHNQGVVRIDDRSYYPAYRFAAQAVSMIENIPVERRPSFVGRIRGAFGNPDDLRAIELEFAIATHFLHRDSAVAWPEMEGSGRVDLRIDGIGKDGLEVEMKSIFS